MKTSQVRSRKLVKLHKQIEAAKLSISLQLATALILTCAVALPVQAENKLRESNWKIAKENVDKFFDMKDKDIADLFDDYEHKGAEYEIAIDEKTELQVNKSNPFNFNQFSFLQKRSFQPTSYRSSIQDSCGSTAMADFRSSDRDDRIWTGAKHKDEKEYWSIIKANLDKFIGMSSEEIKALLGPERCSSEAGKSIDYRVGNNRLRFFLRKDTVIGFEFTNDMYLHDT